MSNHTAGCAGLRRTVPASADRCFCGADEAALRARVAVLQAAGAALAKCVSPTHAPIKADSCPVCAALYMLQEPDND